MPEVTLESEEWYVLGNWLRERENRLMYALRPKSDEWEFVHDLRRTIERQQDQTAGTTETGESAGTAERGETTETAGATERTETTETRETTETVRATEVGETTEMAGASETAGTAETAGTTATVPLSDRQVAYLSSFLRRRARKLLLFPWRSRERRDVRHLRDHLLDRVGRSGDATARSVARSHRNE